MNKRQILLAAGQTKLCRLLDQTSFGRTSCKCQKRISHPLHCARNDEIKAGSSKSSIKCEHDR